MQDLTVNYIDKATLAGQLRDYYATGIPSDALGNSILAIAREMLTSANWREYSTTWQDDMLSEAVAAMWKACLGRKVQPDTAFSYLSRICWNSYRRVVGYCKGRSLGLQGYQAWAKHVGLAFDLDADRGLSGTDPDEMYDYCATAQESRA